MKKEKIQIGNIPANVYGESSESLYIFVHGKSSKKEEAESFANIVAKRGYQVLSFDLPEHGERKDKEYAYTAQNSVYDLKEVYSFVEDRYKKLSLYACSLGVYFSLLAYQNVKFEKCLFLSPILDMGQVIQNMMKWGGVSEEVLKEKSEIETSFGETLSWDYYQYVRNNPIVKWNNETYILYGENDHLTERSVLDSFVKKNNCHLDVMPHGEHYFHTMEQLDYLENWIREVV